MAAAAALTKIGHLGTPRRHHLHCLWRQTSSKHSIHESPKEIARQVQQSKWSSRFTNSILRKGKNLDSSSSSKFGLVGWYLGMIQARPVATKSLTSAFIYTAADLSSQTIVGGNKEEGYDLVRTVRMAGYGMLIIGPSLHYWFNFVSRVLPKRDLLSTVAKMVLGQTVYGPIVTVVFFSGNAALQGESGSEIVGRLKRDLVPTLLSCLMYWPVCDFITFKFIPIHLQPLMSNSFSYLWTVYLTYMGSLEKTIVGGNKEEGYDLVRTVRMAGYGMLIIGPSLHYWFNFVSRVLPKRDLLSTVAKMVLGQTVYGPIVTVVFFSGNAALQGESGSEIVGRLKRDLVPTLLSCLMYWPVCDFITFKFIPIHLQPLMSNSFSYLWTVYLTYMGSLEKVSTTTT